MLPPGVQLTVRARRQALAQRARGLVLDLGGADTHASLLDRPGLEVVQVPGPDARALDTLAADGHRFDTIFSIFRLALVTDLAGTLTQLGSLLRDDGELLFLEPTCPAGLRGRAQRAIAPAVRLSWGWRLDRDIVATVWRSGLSITDIQRHRTATGQWWLHRLVEGAAHRALEPARTDPDAD